MIVQGDVFFIRTQSIPEGALQKSREAKGYVIAKGEATGHAHVIEDEAMLYDKKGTLFVKVSKPVEVRHEEHLPVTLNPGCWEVGIVSEYDPFLEEVQKIQD